MYIFEELPFSQIEEIKKLWLELNNIHYIDSVYFKKHFEEMTFEKRIKSLGNYSVNNFSIFVCKDKKDIVAYVIAGIIAETGEIESLITTKKYLGKGIGKKLVRMCIDWFKKENCKKIKVGVAHGHEDVIEFYFKQGFRPRMTFLELVE